MLYLLLVSDPSGQKGQLCEDIVHRLQFSIQPNYPSAIPVCPDHHHHLQQHHTEHRAVCIFHLWMLLGIAPVTSLCFADDSTVVGLSSINEESPYRKEVKTLRSSLVDHSSPYINPATVESIRSFRFLGVQIIEDLSWTINTTCLAKKAWQHLHFLWRLKRAFPSLHHHLLHGNNSEQWDQLFSLFGIGTAPFQTQDLTANCKNNLKVHWSLSIRHRCIF